MKVYITRKIQSKAIKYLRDNGLTVSVYKEDKPIPKSVLIKNIKNIDALIPLLTDKIDEEIIDSMTKCKIIANFAVGYENIDVDYAKRKNIIVTNTPGVLTDSTADLAMTLALACSRRLFESRKLIDDGKFKHWKPNLLLGYEIKDKIFGIIGAGRIGEATAKRAYAFGAKIFYHSRSVNNKMEKDLNAKKVSLNKLLNISDFISLHIPSNEKTFHLLNKDNLKLLKRNAVIINTARGDIIDEVELAKILKKGKIFSVGLDVYENEPKIHPELLKLNKIVLMPHIGSATVEARTAMAMLAAKNVVNFLHWGKPITPV